MKKREEIAKEYQWNMEDLYGDNEAWEADFYKLQEGIGGLKEYAGTLGSSAEQLLKVMLKTDSTRTTQIILLLTIQAVPLAVCRIKVSLRVWLLKKTPCMISLFMQNLLTVTTAKLP